MTKLIYYLKRDRATRRKTRIYIDTIDQPTCVKMNHKLDIIVKELIFVVSSSEISAVCINSCSPEVVFKET